MSLTERERTVLQLSKQGLSDYKIARQINTDPPSVTRSRKNAIKKLTQAKADLQWAQTTGISTATLNMLNRQTKKERRRRSKIKDF